MTVTFDLFSLIRGIGLVALAVFFLLAIWFAVSGLRRLIASRQYDVGDRDAMRRRWSEVESLLDAPGEMSPKLAVIEADKLLDHALKSLAMPGETLGERLKFAAYKYPHLQRVWPAHQIRNRLVHEASYRLDRGMARKAVRAFREALKMLGAI